MLICYDMVFPESARCLALGGADIIFHPTLGGAAIGDEDISRAAFRTRAVDNFVYIVVSQRYAGSLIISPKGKILSRVRDRTISSSPKSTHSAAATGVTRIITSRICGPVLPRTQYRRLRHSDRSKPTCSCQGAGHHHSRRSESNI